MVKRAVGAHSLIAADSSVTFRISFPMIKGLAEIAHIAILHTAAPAISIAVESHSCSQKRVPANP